MVGGEVKMFCAVFAADKTVVAITSLEFANAGIACPGTFIVWENSTEAGGGTAASPLARSEVTGTAASHDGALETAFSGGSAAGDATEKPKEVPCATRSPTLVPAFPAFAISVGKEDKLVGASCGGVAGRNGAGVGTGTGKATTRPVLDAAGARFFSESLVLPGAAWFTDFCEAFRSVVATVGFASLVGGDESCEAHIAANVPELCAAAFARLKQPAGKTGSALPAVADSMAEVTVRVIADAKAHNEGCI
jgi:hypothetical protein